MIKHPFSLFILFMTIFVVGCSEADRKFWSEPTLSTIGRDIVLARLDTTSIVTIDDILAVERKESSSESRLSTSQPEILGVDSITDHNGETVLFIINYKGNAGYKILSANKSYMPLIAYSDEGNFSLDEAEDNGSGFWLNRIMNDIQSAKQLPDSVKLNNRIEWSNLIGKTSVHTPVSRTSDEYIAYMNYQMNEWVKEGYQIYPLSDFIPKTTNSPTFADGLLPYEFMIHQISTITGREVLEDSYVLLKDNSILSNPKKQQLMKSKWGQGSPYNAMIPHYPKNKDRYLGCTTVALGQIIAYKRYVSGFNYDAMFGSPCDYNEIANLLYDVGLKIGIDYLNGSSGASLSQVQSACSKYGLKYDINSGLTNVVNSINSDIPVYTRGTRDSGGDGHAWVIDGYSFTQIERECKVMLIHAYTEDIIDNQPFWMYNSKHDVLPEEWMYHCNWGWSRSENGFFSENGFNTSLDNFNNSVTTLTNIRKE